MQFRGSRIRRTRLVQNIRKNVIRIVSDLEVYLFLSFVHEASPRQHQKYSARIRAVSGGVRGRNGQRVNPA